MADSKRSEQKEKHTERKTKSCQLRRTNADMTEHFKTVIGNSTKVTDKPIIIIIKSHQDIKLGQFTRNELKLKKLKQKRRNVPRSIQDKEI